MKSRYSRPLVFIGRSLVWAAALYSICMLAVYSDDIINTMQDSGATMAAQIKTPVITQPQVNDTTIVLPDSKQIGITLSHHFSISAIQVSVERLFSLISVFTK